MGKARRRKPLGIMILMDDVMLDDDECCAVLLGTDYAPTNDYRG